MDLNLVFETFSIRYNNQSSSKLFEKNFKFLADEGIYISGDNLMWQY